MRVRVGSLLLLLATLFAIVAASGCGGCGSDSANIGGGGTDQSGGSGTGASAGCGPLGCGGAGFGGGLQGQVIISPQNPTLVVDNGNIPTQAFTVQLDGQDVTASATWAFERPDVGDMGGAIFTPTGTAGGSGKLTATVGDKQGETTVTVTIKKTVDEIGLSPADQSSFDSPSGPDPAMSIVYPYDETVFPLGVLAPELQWNGAQPGDVYRLKITEKYYQYVGFFSAPPPSRHIMAQTDWDGIENSGSGAKSDPLTVELSRKSGPTVYQPAKQTWHVAQGRLHGSVYYWELPDQCQNGNSNGRILRIKPDSTAVDEFFQPGACWGCHTVSRDGAKMAAEFTNGNGPLYTVNLAANPIGYGDLNPGNPTGNYIFSAFNEKGDKLMACDNTAFGPAAATLQIVDAVNGAVLNPNAMGTGCGEPAWSPDGKKLAGICGLGGGGWVFDASTGNLAVADVAADGITVSNVQTIVPQAAGPGRPAYPSFSPGSEHIAFGRPTQGSRSTANGDLWLVDPDGSNPKPLAIASSDNRSFNPVFAPLRAGGYFWIVFITRRDYGNTIVSANRQQLWITAVDDPPSAADPSHPPFYLRGQENCAKSENAYYALDPCKGLGEDCTSGIDCCNGQCIKDPQTGKYVCGEPSGGCSQDGNACTTSADCCNVQSTCVDGFCQPPTPN